MIINKTGMSDMNLFSKCFALTKQRQRFQCIYTLHVNKFKHPELIMNTYEKYIISKFL